VCEKKKSYKGLVEKLREIDGLEGLGVNDR